jgi:hypothetical protein
MGNPMDKTMTKAISLTKKQAIVREAVDLGNSNGMRMGTVNVLFDSEFVRNVFSPFSCQGTDAFVHWDAAPDKEGWHKIDRKAHLFKPLSDAEGRALVAYNEHESIRHRPLEEIKVEEVLCPDEILYVDSSALRAAKEGQPLLLSGANALKMWITLHAGAGPASVVQVDPSHEAAVVPADPKGLLRLTSLALESLAPSPED